MPLSTSEERKFQSPDFFFPFLLLLCLPKHKIKSWDKNYFMRDQRHFNLSCQMNGRTVDMAFTSISCTELTELTDQTRSVGMIIESLNKTLALLLLSP